MRYRRLYSKETDTPVPVAASRGDYSLYPRGIYDRQVTLYLPRTQASMSWSHEWPQGSQNGPGKHIPGDLVEFDSSKIGPRPSHFQPKTIIPAPRGPHPGLSYVTREYAPRYPQNMAPARFYKDPKVLAFTEGVI